MIKEEDRSRISIIILSTVLFLVISAFIFSLFKNIQYPLLWNDESETAMYAKRILQYGYPKIHDGKNIVWLTELPDKSIGINKKFDSPSALVWGQYYFAAIGAFFAEKADDLYLKTALIRIPFAIAGFAGLVIMGLSMIGLCGNKIIYKLTFLSIFFSFALSSTALILHIREARHPALVLFLSAITLYIYLGHRFYGRIETASYFISLTASLFILYHVVHVVCFIFFAAIGLYETIALLKERDIKSFLSNVMPLFFAFTMVLPLFLLCQIAAFGKAYRLLYSAYIPSWAAQISGILGFFERYELLYPILMVKAAFFCIFVIFLNRRLDPGSSVRQKMRVSNFLSLFFVVYLIIISKFPHQFIFERYYIVLIPVLAMILSLDIFGAFELFSRIPDALLRKQMRWSFAALFIFVLSLNVADRIDHMQGHIYELFHQYKGPLDFSIPFIKSHYKNTENLVIATNYEELVYMYYLGSRVIIGFVGNNVEEEANMRPDIIIFRKQRDSEHLAVFNNFLLKDKYEKISFPVLDYFVNNISELRYHLYLTPLLSDKRRCLDIFVRSSAGGAA